MSRSKQVISGFVCILILITAFGTLAETQTQSVTTQVVFDGQTYENRTDITWQAHKPIPEGGVKWDGTADYLSIRYPDRSSIMRNDEDVQYIDNEIVFHAVLEEDVGSEFEAIQQLMADYDMRIVGYIALTATYQVESVQSKSYSELLELVALFNAESLIQKGTATFNYIHERILTESQNEYIPFTDDQNLWLGDTIDTLSPQGYNWNMEYIGAPNVWAYDSILNKIRVVVLDSGVNNHVDYALDDPKELNAEGSDHGSHVAGVIAATHNNYGISGIFHNAQLVAVKHYDKEIETELYLYDFPYYSAYSLVFAVQMGNDSKPPLPTVINYSIGNTAETQQNISSNPNAAIEEVEFITTHLNNILDREYEYIICAAAGNSGPDYNASINSNLTRINNKEISDRIIVVGSFGMDQQSKLIFHASDSQTGDRVDLIAPGIDIYSTLNKNTYGHMSGTSMACPHAAGTAAAVWAVDPTKNGKIIKEIIVNSATSSLAPQASDLFRTVGNYPVLNAFSAFSHALKLATSGSISVNVWEKVASTEEFVTFTPAANAYLKLFDMNGQPVAAGFSNKSGIHVFYDLEPGIYTVEASKSGFDDSPTSTQITLKSGMSEAIELTFLANTTVKSGTVSGCVIDQDNQPLEGVAVFIKYDKENFNAATKTDGSYELNVPWGIYSLVFEKVGYTPVTVEFKMFEEEGDWTLILDAVKLIAEVSVVTGSVIDAEDQPLSDVTMTVKKENQLVAEQAISGNFRLTTLDEGAYSFTFTKSGLKPVTLYAAVSKTTPVDLGAITLLPDAPYSMDVWDGSTKSEPKTSGDFYLIEKASELAWVADVNNSGGIDFSGKTLLLKNGLNFNDYTWTPIGTSAHPFKGSMNGGGYPIQGLYLASDAGGWNDGAVTCGIGLFDYVVAENKSAFRNLNLDAVDFKVDTWSSQRMPMGGLAGRITLNEEASVTIENCTVTGTLYNIYSTSGYVHTGGVVGMISAGKNSTVSFRSVSVASTITTAAQEQISGGVIGSFSAAGGGTSLILYRCDATTLAYGNAPLYGNAELQCQAGLLGTFDGAFLTIEQCAATSTLRRATNKYYNVTVAGFVGKASYNMLVLEDSFANLTTVGTGAKVCISTMMGDSYCTGTPDNSFIKNCFAIGSIADKTAKVGFVTSTDEATLGISILNSYYDTTATGITADTVFQYITWGGGVGHQAKDIPGIGALTSTEVTKQASFANWNFDTVWEMTSDYPRLRKVGN